MDDLKIGIYAQFKGGEIEMLFIASNSETLEKFVVYRALDNNQRHDKDSIWIRPLKMLFLMERLFLASNI